MLRQIKRPAATGLHEWSRPGATVQAKTQKSGNLEDQGYRPALGRHSIGRIAVDHKGSNSESSVGRTNRTGLPNRIKHGVEALSGVPLDDVTIHYNSPKPARVQALAYAQGKEIHLGPGQERHLPHEVWHVVQQKQGRVSPTLHSGAVNVNDDPALEKEADVLPGRAVAAVRPLSPSSPVPTQVSVVPGDPNVIQRIVLANEDAEERPAQPHRSLKDAIPGIGMDATLHHVIPWNQLREFLLIANREDPAVVERILESAITTMMKISPIATRGNLAGRQVQGDDTQETLLAELENRGPNAVRRESVQAILAAYAWMPGNLFHGPNTNLRVEDPGERFEEHAADAVGRKFESLREADQLITEYRRKPTTHMARRIEKLLQQAARQSYFFPYNPEVWKEVAAGRYRLKAKRN